MKYVDCRYAGDAPVEFIKASEGIGRVLRECHNCGADIQPGEWRKAITGKYKDEIGTRYYCAKCEERTSTGEPACLPNQRGQPAATEPAQPAGRGPLGCAGVVGCEPLNGETNHGP